MAAIKASTDQRFVEAIYDEFKTGSIREYDYIRAVLVLIKINVICNLIDVPRSCFEDMTITYRATDSARDTCLLIKAPLSFCRACEQEASSTSQEKLTQSRDLDMDDVFSTAPYNQWRSEKRTWKPCAALILLFPPDCHGA